MSRPRGLGVLLMLSAGLPAAALWTGLRPGAPWATEVLILVAVAHGGAGGALYGRFRPAEDPADPGAAKELVDPADPGATKDLVEVGAWLGGAAARYLVFLGAVVFGAVEAHAIGVGIQGGAPRLALLLLLPPFAVAALALRGALARRDRDPGEGERA